MTIEEITNEFKAHGFNARGAEGLMNLYIDRFALTAYKDSILIADQSSDETTLSVNLKIGEDFRLEIEEFDRADICGYIGTDVSIFMTDGNSQVYLDTKTYDREKEKEYDQR